MNDEDDYDENEDELAGEPVEAASTFDPASLNGELEFSRVDDWRPGRRVSIARRQAPLGVSIFLTMLAAIAAGLAGAFPAWSMIRGFVGGDSSGRYVAAGCAAMFGGCLAWFLARNNFRRRELVFDWLQKQVTWRVGEAASSWPLDEIKGFVLCDMASGGDDESPEYLSQLNLVAPDREVPVIKTEKPAKTSAAACKRLAPLAAELAAALGTSCSHSKSSGDVDVAEKLRLSWFQKVVLASLALASAALFLAAAVPQQIENRAAARLRELGLDISLMGSFTRDDDLIGENFWNVTVAEGQSPPRLDDEAKRLLAGLRKVGLDAGESKLTDDDLIALGAVNWSIVNVSQTAVSDRGIAAIAASDELFYLDAYDTHVGDEAMQALARSPRLRFLYLPGAKVTDEGLKHLESIPTLKLVHLGACPVSPDGVEALRRALPDARVIFK